MNVVEYAYVGAFGVKPQYIINSPRYMSHVCSGCLVPVSSHERGIRTYVYALCARNIQLVRRPPKQAGFIISCVGSVRNVILRLAGAERPGPASPPTQNANNDPESCLPEGEEERRMGCGQNQQQPFLCTGPDDRFEVLSLEGTLSRDGLHLHASLGDEEGTVSGGHLVRAIIHTTAEIVVGEASALAFSRAMDPDTGFKELVVARRDGVGRRIGGGGSSGGDGSGRAAQR